MKVTIKNFAVFMVLLAMVLVVLGAVDKASKMTATNTKTYLKVTVVDLQGKPVHNAQVTVCGKTFFTDNNGVSPQIELPQLTNSYDSTITSWHTVNFFVTKTDYVPAMVFNCVTYHLQTRKLTIKLYPVDSSELPYVSYVESPPDQYVKQLLQQK